MDKGVLSRIAIVLVGIMIFSSILGGTFHYLSLEQRQAIFNVASFGSIAAIVTGVISSAVFTLLILNFRIVGSFVRQTIEPADHQITGDWYVSRYLKENNKSEVCTDKWYIGRGWSGGYNVKIPYADDDGWDWELSGRILYNERDRLNILLDGANHRQQSLISFQMNIPRTNDTRILGLGVGDDCQYVLSTRVYLASRHRLDDNHIKKVIDNATDKLRTNGANSPLSQLPTDIISTVFQDNFPPEISEASNNERKRTTGVFETLSMILKRAGVSRRQKTIATEMK
jgi:hypothetical protein